MKYAIAIVILAAALVLWWVAMNGSGSDLSMVVIAVIAVIFFSTLPVLLGVVYRRKSERQGASIDRTRTVVVVNPQTTPPLQAAHTEPTPQSTTPNTGHAPT